MEGTTSREDPVEAPTPAIEAGHLSHLKSLQDENRLHFVGHTHDGSHGFLIISADSKREAKQLAERDPAIVNGFFDSVTVTPLAAPYPVRS
ncbi:MULTISPECIES: YciI family protein [Streptomyces]|uniref:YciI family protein n=1 Tax=Streptomyces TaxID=1883 RepID=UPI003460473E